MIREHLIRYLIGGICIFLFSISLLYFFVDVLGLWYLWGTTLTFIICLGVSFTVQKYWTFRDHSTDGLKAQMGFYVTLQLINLAANDGLMYIGVSKVGLSHLIAQVFTTGTIAAWSFWAYRHLFRQKTS